jgi:porphobilinogen synthase
MVKSSAAAGLANEQAAVMEVLTAIKRAGADIIITYSAKDVARLLS